MVRVDLRSDTVTRPTPAMRRVMAEAEVGDDVYGDDPSVNRLEAEIAEIAGKEAAVFVPSGTMANQIAVQLHARPGDEIVLEENAHIYLYEAGGAAAMAGVTCHLVPGDRGVLSVAAIEAALRPVDVHFPPAVALAVEDTSNRGGGSLYPIERLRELAAFAADRGMATHVDGARAFHAVVASGVPLDVRLRGWDTASICFSKGLGAPVGSALVGRRDAIAVARRHRKRLGGGMRQAGILAAAASYALAHHVERLADDHARAARLAEGLAALGVIPDPCPTNLLFVTVPGAFALRDALAARGVLLNATGPTRLRLVTHLDVDDAAVTATLAAFAEVLSER